MPNMKDLPLRVKLLWPMLKFFNGQTDRQSLRAKSRKYKGVFEVKSRVKTWQVRGIWSQQLEHKSHNGRRNQVSGRVSVPCWHATPVANAPWKPLLIGEGQARHQGHEIGGKSDWLGSHRWSRIRMSLYIREGYFILLNKITVSTIKLHE